MKPDEATSNPVETWSVTVLYDRPEARQCATRACDRLLQRFWSRIEFDLTWWSLQELEGPESASAGHRLQQADIIILALTQPRSLTPSILNWLLQVLQPRQGREGALIVLCAGTDAPLHQIDPELNAALHRLARGTGLDFLNQAPSCLPGRVPQTIDHFARRAEENTDVIRRILSSRPSPPWAG